MQVIHKKILFIFRQPPLGSSKAQEALDILLMASTQQHIISVIFIGDGIWQLKACQEKNFTAAYKALPLYDVNNIYADKISLKDRGLNADELVVSIELLEAKEIADIMQQHDVIFNF